MNPLEIRDLFGVAADTRARACCATDALAALVVREGVPSEWTTQMEDVAHALFNDRQYMFPHLEAFEPLRATLRDACGILASRSGFVSS